MHKLLKKEYINPNLFKIFFEKKNQKRPQSLPGWAKRRRVYIDFCKCARRPRLFNSDHQSRKKAEREERTIQFYEDAVLALNCVH